MQSFCIIFVLVLAPVIKGETVSATVKEFEIDVEIPDREIISKIDQILDATSDINKKIDEVKGCSCPRFNNAVFHVANGRYTYNFYDAQNACEARGAKLASLAQLQAAWEAGLDACVAGWLSDGTVRYPITMPRPGCGSNVAGIRNWGSKPKNQKVADAYCFKQ